MNRLLALATLLSTFSLSGCFDGTPDRVEDFGFEAPIQRVEAFTGSGDIEIQGDAAAVETTVRARVYGDATEVVARLDAGVLELRHHCPKRLRRCGVDWIVVLPSSDEDRILEASTGSGDIDLFDTQGNIIAHTASGDIGLHDVVATELDLETGSGDIGARVQGALESVRAETGSGDVALRVPSGAYQIHVDTGSGDVSTRGLSNDPTAERVIEVDTGSGDVALRGS